MIRRASYRRGLGFGGVGGGVHHHHPETVAGGRNPRRNTIAGYTYLWLRPELRLLFRRREISRNLDFYVCFFGRYWFLTLLCLCLCLCLADLIKKYSIFYCRRLCGHFINKQRVIPDPRFICLAPLNSNRSRGVPPPSDGVGVVVVGGGGGVVGGNNPSNCLLIYCASSV